MRRLSDNGYECYLVGGCVRDSIAGITPHDFDLTTSAFPSQTAACFHDYKVIDIGIKHGTVAVISEGHTVEITTYRVDGEYSDNRHPREVRFTRSLKDDLSRRDFTVNAIAMDSDLNVVDLFGGISDIKSKIIRCVGNPENRFDEDGLRIIRAIRFASVLGFDIDGDTSAAIHKKRELLLNISVERIFAELQKLICGQNAEQILLDYADVIGEIIPEFKPCIGFDQRNPHHCYDVYTHIVKSVSAAQPDVVIRLVMLFHDIGKPCKYTLDSNGIGHFKMHPVASMEIADTVLRRLKCSNKLREEVCTLIKMHDDRILPRKKSIVRWIRKLGYGGCKKLIEIQRADAKAHAPGCMEETFKRINEIEKLINEYEQSGLCCTLDQLAISGTDIIAAGVKPGETVGVLLNKLLDQVTYGECENSREALLEHLDRLI